MDLNLNVTVATQVVRKENNSDIYLFIPGLQIHPTEVWKVNRLTLESFAIVGKTLLPETSVFYTKQEVNFGI